MFESVYIAFVIMVIIYYLLILLEQKIGRQVQEELYFEVDFSVNRKIRELIDMGALETTKEYKDNPEMIYGSKFKGKAKVAPVK